MKKRGGYAITPVRVRQAASSPLVYGAGLARVGQGRAFCPHLRVTCASHVCNLDPHSDILSACAYLGDRSEKGYGCADLSTPQHCPFCVRLKIYLDDVSI